MCIRDSSEDDRYETISIESKVREGVFHKVVKDLETGKAVSVLANVGVKVTSLAMV